MSVEKEASIIQDFEASASHFFIVALFQDRIVGGLGIMGDAFQRVGLLKESASWMAPFRRILLPSYFLIPNLHIRLQRQTLASRVLLHNLNLG
jgi:hypothetical protein